MIYNIKKIPIIVEQQYSESYEKLISECEKSNLLKNFPKISSLLSFGIFKIIKKVYITFKYIFSKNDRGYKKNIN